MSNQPKHRPAPWTVFTEETADGENTYPKLMTADYKHEIFAYGNSSAQDFADADFVVHSVNCHADLLEALEIAQKKLKVFHLDATPIDVAKDEGLNKIRAALRKAKQP